MYKEQKKNAPEAATSETKSNNNITTNSIADNNEKIKVVLKHPGEISVITEIDNTIKSINGIVGGLSTCVTTSNGLTLAMNVYTKRKEALHNLKTLWGNIYGTVVLTASNADGFVSLTNEQIQTAQAWLIKHSV